MRTVTALILTLFFFSCKSSFEVVEKPTDYSLVVANYKVRGALFLENADCFMCLQDKNRYSPTLADVEKAERILKAKLKDENHQLMNQLYGCPVIHKNLNNYRRQYFGYISESGDSIIYASFNWDKYTIIDRVRGIEKDERDNWKKEIETVLDGCSYHWYIKINLTKEELFDLDINGSA